MTSRRSSRTTPSPPARDRRGLLLIVSGPSGAGKTTITRALQESLPDSIFSVSATTRPKTKADVDGRDYHFLSDQEFDRRVDQGAFLEHAIYNGSKYGTLRGPVEEQLASGRLVILDIDIQGAIQVKQAVLEALALFILPPSEESLLQRLRGRQRESEEQIQRRFEIAKREIAQAKECGVYDALIVNDELERAIGEALAIIESHRTPAPDP